MGEGEVMRVADEKGGVAHVECALLSPTVDIVSYSRLAFVRRDKVKPVVLDCCGKSSAGPVVMCVVCGDRGHFRCLIVERGEDEDFYMISRWLDKCEKFDFLLMHVISKGKSDIKDLLECGEPWVEGKLMVCDKHKDDYPWCPCNNKEISHEAENPSYGCDTCNRYYHQPCSGLPPNRSDKKFKCDGCRTNDMYKKELKLH
jgi:hypothetical protein